MPLREGGGLGAKGLPLRGKNFIIIIKLEGGSMDGVVGGKALIARPLKKQERSSFIEAKIIDHRSEDHRS